MWRHRLITSAVVAGIVTAFVALLFQPWLTQWGSTAAERSQPMPGDELVADARRWTRSITIAAPPERVWPWLVQIGVDKGGFYTYDWAEQLFGDPVHNTTRIHPEWQDLRAGDEVRPYPVGPAWIAQVVDPDRLLILTGDQGRWSWTIQLQPLPDERTRVVTRMSSRPALLGRVLDPADLIVIPRLLVGLEQRAEGTLPGMPGTSVGAPLPTARLPVQWWAALTWLAGLALFAAVATPMLGWGRWARTRRHPWMVAAVAFVAGAGYMIMSDTPPVQFFTNTWGAGLILAVAAGVLLGRTIATSAPRPRPRRHAVSGVVAAFTESGLFVVIPATAVWQAATTLGWNSSPAGHVITAAAATLAAAAVAGLAWRRGGSPVQAAAVAAVLAAGYAATGSALVPLLGAVVVELTARLANSSGAPPGRRITGADTAPLVPPRPVWRRKSPTTVPWSLGVGWARR